MGHKCKCLIVDDHPIFRKGIRNLLSQEAACTAIVEADCAATALAAIRREPWDLLILDVALPDKHGLEVLKEVKLLRPKLPVLMLSLYPEREFALRAFKAGASAYLTKDGPPSELLSAVKEVVAGRRYITGSLADQLMDFLDSGQPATPHAILSDREMEVLRLLGQGKRPSQIADEMALSVKTISTYRARLLEKLGLQSTAQLVRYAIEHRLTT
ncbi:MAG: response regulator transcription factor [Nitrospirae bacterium]|jgi:two-component system invasion response regulator UvrY|nr:response regulator transcription factor [Nitrospirota bacterium]